MFPLPKGPTIQLLLPSLVQVWHRNIGGKVIRISATEINNLAGVLTMPDESAGPVMVGNLLVEHLVGDSNCNELMNVQARMHCLIFIALYNFLESFPPLICLLTAST